MMKYFSLALISITLVCASFGQKPTSGDSLPANTTAADASKDAGKPLSRYVPKTEPARIPRFETPPVIDGKLDDAVWKTAAVFGDFLQTQPGDNVQPSNPTEVMIGYDAKNIYF